MAFPPPKPYKLVCPKCKWSSQIIASDVIPPEHSEGTDTFYNGTQCPKCYTPLNQKEVGVMDSVKSFFGL
ncbi:hypothetical protein F9B74_01550 [Pelistega sp. NLN82]|uniref:Uncharacterized protein n=1 Tax=Pelistega ratti TaxID=2652177 RepID=A0A6L9Y4A3_9BURK|nr:hypothetical protein [Pelistega ratti]NEN75015.1 hypothetical protein [Pelistega ratti]